MLALLAGGTLAAGARPQPAALAASAPLGTVITATVNLDNTGLPAATALLYEALEAPTAASVSPPSTLRVPLPEDPGPLTSQLLEAFAKDPQGQADFIIYLSDQADLSAAAARPDWNERGAAVVDTLRAHAARTQAALLAQLEAAGRQPTPYWIVNAIRVNGDRALAEWAAAQPGVALVGANVVHQLEDGLAPEPTTNVAAAGDPAWGVDLIEAPSTWADWGVRGSGIVVATIDTGAAFTHTALLPTYRGWSPTGVDHNYNWFDAAGEPPQSAPVDSAGHGTHVMGTIAGRAAGIYSALGVAPEARWIAARGCVGVFCADAGLIASAQWLLAPTNLNGANPRPDLRPHIINNSWGKPGEDNWYVGYVQAWNASGIFSVFANGNQGTVFGCGSSGSPGQYGIAFSVGATDADDFIAGFSSRGPTSDGRIKPDISAPGVAVPSAWPDGTVRNLNGTSMAAPHVTGAAILLWSANPALVGNLAATRAALTGSAVPRTSPECGPSATAVPNNVYGWGRLNARQAVQSARVDVPWLSVPAAVALPANGVAPVTLTLDARQVATPGTYTARLLISRLNSLSSIPVTFEVLPATGTAQVTGQLTDVWNSGPVYGQVEVGAGPNVRTDAGGHFTMTLPYGVYSLTAAATGYISTTEALDVATNTDLAFSLMPDLPHMMLAAGPPLSATLAFGERYTGTLTLSNNGTQPLRVTASVPPLEWVVDAAGVSGTPLYDLSAAPAIALADDTVYEQPLELGFSLPVYGQLVSRVYLSSNGWISVQPSTSAAPLASCVDGSGLPPGSLAAFWTDLDPSAGGAVRAAAVDADTFVVSFEDVPHWKMEPDPAAPTYTFQIVLHAGGAVDFVYGAMGELPARWAAGASLSSARSQSLFCFKSPAELSNRRWTLHNQPSAATWLSAASEVLVVLPGQTTQFPVVLKGFGFVPWLTEPFVGSVRLSTNDPSQAAVNLPAQAIVGPPVATFWFPVMRH